MNLSAPSASSASSSEGAAMEKEMIEFLPELVYFMTRNDDPKPTRSIIYFSVDNKLFYNNFYLDFGPLNIGSTFQFCHAMSKLVENAKQRTRKIVVYSSDDLQLRTNAVCLLCCWGVLYLKKTPQEAFAPFSKMEFPTFHDATPIDCTYPLSILDCLNGLEKAVKSNYIHVASFNVENYHFYEQVENGDLSWISNKFIAFA